MAFYYEAEQPTWRYKQRYKSFQEFKKKDQKALEKLWQKWKKGERTVTMNWRNPDQQTDITLNIQTMKGSGRGYYGSQVDMERIGFPYPDPEGKNTPEGPLQQMFDAVKDPDDPSCMSEDGIWTFVSNLKIDIESKQGEMQLFMFHAMCEASDMTEIEREPFVNIMRKCGCMTFKDIKRQITLIEDNMYKFGDSKAKKVNKAFARWVFSFSATEPKAKSVLFYPEARKEEEVQAADEEEDDGLPVLQVVFNSWILEHPKAAATFPLGPQMFKFLSQRPQNSVSKDSLVNIAEFMMTKRDTNISEDELFNWPLIIGDFCEWNNAQ